MLQSDPAPVAFLAMVVISLGVVIIAFVASRPLASAEEKERKRRYRKEIIRQARAQSKKRVSNEEERPQEGPPLQRVSDEERRPQGTPPNSAPPPPLQ